MLIPNSSIPNLLVTDDDSAFRSVLCEGLLRRGFNVTEAGDGMEAIELIEQSEVHACLIDFHMPKLNGVEVIRHIRQRSNQTPCVLMSADLDETIRAQAQQVSVYEVLSKPIRLKQISDLICNALSDVYGWRPA
jgi:CheY-like chemotaxis protein